MDWNKRLRSFKHGPYEKIRHTQADLQEKEDNQKTELLKKQAQDVQTQSLFFSFLKFKKNQSLLRMRLLKMIRELLAFRKRKNQLKMRQRLKAVNTVLEILKEQRKKQEQEKEDFFAPKAKPFTLFKDLMAIRTAARSAILKKQRELHNQGKSSKLE